MSVPSAGPLKYRDAVWDHLGEEVFDVAVIGGGINGAGVARDAVLRGMSVAVIERGDFASGTSSRSSKLIHGGVRYLENGDLGLVLEACRERDLLRTTLAPHLVKAQRFLFPVYDDDELPRWKLRLGLLLYDSLAAFRNVDRHRMLSKEAIMESEPALLHDGLRGGAVYYDCATDDARLTLENVLAARSGGAAVLNYAGVSALEKDSSGNLAAAQVEDLVGGRSCRLRARCFVNATGPWMDHLRRLDDGGAPPRLRVTKGVHAVFERSRVGNNDAVVIRGEGDGRVMFAIPWQDRTLVGTTDTYYEGDPGEVGVEAEDIEYILAAVNRAFPRARLGTKDLIAGYAGLRPLVAPEDELDGSRVSRDDQIFESPSGLISIGGGKLTTYRHVAERIVDRAAVHCGRQVGRCRTASVPLPGAVGLDPGEAPVEPPQSLEEHVRWRYGALAPEVAKLAGSAQRLTNRLVADLPDLEAEVVYGVDHEMAMTLEDVLTRRLGVALRSKGQGESAAVVVAELMGARLGWDEARATAELRRFERMLASSRLGGEEEGEHCNPASSRGKN